MDNFSDPTKWPTGTWILAISMAIAGGIVNWIVKIRDPELKTTHFSFVELMGEVFISGFTGIGTFMFLAASGVEVGVCSAGAGVAGHLSTRLLFLLERRLEAYFDKK